MEEEALELQQKICMKTGIRLALWIKTEEEAPHQCGVFSFPDTRGEGNKASCGWKGGYLKQKKCVFFIVSILLSLILSIQVYAVGDGNLDGGGGSMGQGTSQNSWSPGNEGVRVTVIRAESHDPVTRPIDLTNKHPNIAYSFGKVSKMSYTRGSALMIDTNPYEYVNPAQSLPRIISSKSLGQANIEQIKSYFTDEQVVRSIAGLTGMDFDTLVGGEYRLLLEPISFLKFQGTLIAVTATEAALYDEMLSGGLRAVLPTVAFQNLPLSMFLETPDLGYPAWEVLHRGIRSNSEIKKVPWDLALYGFGMCHQRNRRSRPMIMSIGLTRK